MGVAVYAIGVGLHQLTLHPIINLIIMILSGVLIYLGLIIVKYGSLKTLVKELKK
jgi:hypothetical protein